jgi:hypothetical protein
MYVIVDLIILPLTCSVFIGLFVIIMALDGVGAIYRCLTAGK